MHIARDEREVSPLMEEMQSHNANGMCTDMSEEQCHFENHETISM